MLHTYKKNLATSHMIIKRTKINVSIWGYWPSHVLPVFLHTLPPWSTQRTLVQIALPESGFTLHWHLIHVLITAHITFYSNYLLTGLSSLSLILLVHRSSPYFDVKKKEPALDELVFQCEQFFSHIYKHKWLNIFIFITESVGNPNLFPKSRNGMV